MQKKIVVTGVVFILLGIILGAMAAHALEKIISAELINTFEKGVKYQFYIGLGLLIIGLNTDKINFNLKPFFLLSLIGVVLFSGSIYLYALHENIPALRPAAFVVPFGGVAMIAAWLVLLIQFVKKK